MTAMMADGTTVNATQYHRYPLPPERSRWFPNITRMGYRMPDPRTGRLSTFTRATTISHTLDDGFGLNAWQKRNALTGTVLRPDEHARFAAVLNAEPNLSAGTIDGYVEAFEIAAGGAEAREFGTAVHAWLDAVDMGHVLPSQVPDMFRAHVDNYLLALNRNVMVPVRSMRERVVFNPVANAIGTLDVVYGFTDGSADVLGDVKTSKTLDYGYLDYAIQLAIYAGASHMWDPDTMSWVPMHPVNQDYAVLFHCPSDAPQHTIAVTFDLEAGRAALDMALSVRAMRSGAKAHIPNKHALPIPSAEHRRKHDAMTAVHRATHVGDLADAWEEYQDVWNTHLDELARTVQARLESAPAPRES